MTVLSDEHLAKIVSSVTETMVGIAFTVSRDRDIDERLMAHTALLTIGDEVLTVGLATDEKGCTELGAALFYCAASAVDASMRKDSLSELVNMTAGQIKGALLLDKALGLPRIVADGSPRPGGPGWRQLCLKANRLELVLLLSEMNGKGKNDSHPYGR